MQKDKFFIAILPGSILISEINSFRKKYLEGLNVNDEHKKFPHITLQHTFSRPGEVAGEMVPHLSEIAKNVHPFEIELSGIGQFEHRVIFIGVRENPELLRLHLSIKEMLISKMRFNQNEVAAHYKPHITLEKKITNTDFKFYWNKVSEQKFEGTFTCNSFSLMKHNGSVWEEGEKYDLKI